MSLNTIDKAIESVIAWQVGKASAAGFVTGLGGLITLPAAIPANFASVAYIQLRMITCIAHLRGYDIRSDQVKTMAFACLCGTQVTNLLKDAGVQIAQKLTYNFIMKQIPRELLYNINRAVGFRLVTKAGTTGIINIVRVVPGIGGIVNASVDGAVTRVIGRAAKSVFNDQAREC